MALSQVETTNSPLKKENDNVNEVSENAENDCNQNVDTIHEVSSVSEEVISTSTIVNEQGTETSEIILDSSKDLNENKSTAETPSLSKSALKKKRKREQWEQQKQQRRMKEKEKRKKKKLENPGQSNTTVTRKQLKDSTMAKSNCKVTVVVDLSLEKFMDDKSLAKCIKQISRCYSINRRAANPVQFHVTSLEGRSLNEMSKNSGYINWDVNFNVKPYMDIFSKEKIVYLTSESDNVIEKIEDDKIYIIGGLVDHNSHKGLCHRLAQEKDLQHGRLPIGENIDMKTRKVLTIDHVFNIMVNVCNGQNWKEALLEVLPARKGAQEKLTEENSDSEADPTSFNPSPIC